MFSKLVCIAALATVALARNDRDALELKDAFDASSDRADDIEAKITAAEHGTGMIAEGVAAADASVSSRLSTLADAIATINTDAAAVEDDVNSQLDDNKDFLDAELASTKDSISDQMKAAILLLSNQITKQKKAIDDAIDEKLEARTEESEAIVEQFDAVKARLAKRQKCSEDGLVWHASKGECIQVAVADGASMARVTHQSWNNEDGREGGYINSRNIRFTKYYDETYMRILYFDNLRVHGHTAHGTWNLMICDANGNGCSQCADPGRLQNWRYSSHQGNWWMNDHVGGTIFGLCRKAENRELNAGEYMIRAYMSSARYDMCTGWNQYGSFTVDEVMKY